MYVILADFSIGWQEIIVSKGNRGQIGSIEKDAIMHSKDGNNADKRN
jgi:hypothetical protein